MKNIINKDLDLNSRAFFKKVTGEYPEDYLQKGGEYVSPSIAFSEIKRRIEQELMEDEDMEDEDIEDIEDIDMQGGNGFFFGKDPFHPVWGSQAPPFNLGLYGQMGGSCGKNHSGKKNGKVKKY